jgi:predicted nucleotidyltransferase component of viral defense system
MFNWTLRDLNKKAEDTNFQRDTLEKVARLGDLLDFMNTTPPLRNHLALKGGTAIHLTVFPMLRLSVDIDMDFHSNSTKDEMINVRNQITDLCKRYMHSQGYQLSERSRYSFSLDSFVFQYTNLIGNPDNITLEINYSNRCHLFDPIRLDSISPVLDPFPILTVSKIDLFGSKIAALIDRTTPRDIYDVLQMISTNVFLQEELSLLKKSAIFYLSLSVDDLVLDNAFANAVKKMELMTFYEIKRTLIPVLKRGVLFDIDGASRIVTDFLRRLFTLDVNENEYLNQLRLGHYMPTLLFDDKLVVARIANHPMAIWKTQNRNQ